ncbi:MAG: glycine betaine ABC transporter substrate-binding protein [Thermoanaerobaculia bacterium]
MTRCAQRTLQALLLLTIALPLHAADRIVVGSKNFEESRLLAEMFAQLLESRTQLQVERRLGLAGTQVCFEALKSGAIDVYPEYTGTGLVSILGEKAQGGPDRTLNRVRAEFLQRWNVWWLAPLGFENSWEIAVPRELAEREHLETISDLARVSKGLHGGFGHEFVGREDGLLGLQRVYGLRFRSIDHLQQAIQYQAAKQRTIDALDVYSTDGRLILYNLKVLKDDRQFFPPYEAAALVRGETLKKHPEVGSVLGLLAGSLSEDAMRGYNLRLQEKHESEAVVARDALRAIGLSQNEKTAPERSSRKPGILAYFWGARKDLGRLTLQHLGLSAAALLLGALIAIPLGLWLERHRRWAETVIRLLGLLQTVPSLALLAFMIPLLGVGAVPAIVALWLYSLFPIVRNTYTGVRDADPRAVEAATALGMTPGQILRQVRLPLAAPVVMAGLRTAAVITVGTATLAAFIGAGGLGEPIVTGLQLADSAMILSGAIPAALLALVVDGVLGVVERSLRPAGLERVT